MQEPLWRPDEERIARTALAEFQRRAAEAASRPFTGYFDLHAWSVEDPAAFWDFYRQDAAIPFRGRPASVISADPMPATRWFEGVSLNYAQALLQPSVAADGDRDAILALDESGGERAISFGQLRRDVARAQRALASAGVGRGDRVAAFAANVPETVTLLLACAGVGAIFTSCSPDFGFDAALARFGQVRPKMLAATVRYRYGGKRFDVASVVSRLARELGDVPVVALPYPNEEGAPEGTVAWSEWLGGGTVGDEEVTPGDDEPTFAPLPFDHPLYVLYSSGTTGAPKAIVHRAGGALLTHHKEHRLHSDIGPGDRVLYFTTCGWMMWNWLVSVLAQGATAVLYEGSPAHPDLDVLWRVAERHRLTLLGVSARYIHTLQAQGARPGRFDLTALRTVASTGSPLSPAGFDYVYRHVKGDLHLASISGGTDIVGCFMLGVPTLPVYAGEIQAPGLAVDLAAYDDSGRAMTGAPGELVCRQPLPSMPLSFWNDEGGERYRSAYFERFPGVWHHGDMIEITERGGVVVYGRSDATLNPGGVRIGTAEVYHPLDDVAEVVEVAAVGRRVDGDEEIWLFVVLAAGCELDDALTNRIRSRIREGASPRHVPRRVLAVSQLPRTRSGKPMELAVAGVVNGHEVRNRSVIENPESLEEIERAVRAVEGKIEQ